MSEPKKHSKVKSIIEIKVDHLVKHFQKDTGLADDDPIVKTLRRDCLFSLRMSYGKEDAKKRRAEQENTLFDKR